MGNSRKLTDSKFPWFSTSPPGYSTFAATYGHRTVELRDGRVVREVKAPRDPQARVVPLRP